jgi:NTP pyrophosphatase (non-canonical NTP hydrolase)|tara:strand:+ start:216 stop:599 length:384 start_codon:yes stop_codon:yes gene_type:complete
MDHKTHQKESERTCPQLNDELRKGLADEMHMVMGIATEAGELLDAYKKHFAYGKELDTVNVGEEIADIMWYVHNLCRILDIDMGDMLQKNIDKLKARFPDKFDSGKALNRDLGKERSILEGNLKKLE